MLRIVSKAATVEGFVQIFARLCDRESMFIVTPQPKGMGTRTRFSVSLETGEPMLVGEGEVVETYRTRDNRFGRPGMKLRFIELEGHSRDVLERLIAARSPAMRPPPGRMQPARRSRGKAPRADTAADTAIREPHAVAALPGSEERCPGSDFILPANPFGEVTDDTLEAFVECAIYEDVGALGHADAPGAGWPGAAQPWPAGTMPPSPSIRRPGEVPIVEVPLPPAAASQVHPGSAAAITYTQGTNTQGMGAQGTGPQSSAANAPPEPLAERRPQEITALIGRKAAPARAPGASWKSIAVATGVAIAIGLGAGYLLWGSRASKDAPRVGADPTPESAASGAAPAPAPAPAPATDAGNATDAGAADAQADMQALGASKVDAGSVGESTEPGAAAVGERSTEPAEAAAAGELRQPVTLRIESVPPGAEITVDGKAAGTTPAAIEVAGYRRVKVQLRLAGYKRYEKRVHPKPPMTKVRARLRKARR